MRITCPECGAQYEIDPELVPKTGRDVQCSACDKIWSQKPTEAAPEPAPGPAEAGPRPRLDEATRDILVEEARSAARRRSGDAPSTQPPTGSEAQVDAPGAGAASEPRPRSAPQPVGGLRKASASSASLPQRDEPKLEAPRAGGAPRRDPPRPRTDLLPDSEESGATITRRPGAGAGAAAPAAPEEPARAGSGGFLPGFVFVLIAAILLVAVYLAAPTLAGRIPALENELAAYVDVINLLRQQVDIVLQSLAQAAAGA